MQRTLDVQADRAGLRYGLQRAAALPAGQRIPAVDAALAATGGRPATRPSTRCSTSSTPAPSSRTRPRAWRWWTHDQPRRARRHDDRVRRRPAEGPRRGQRGRRQAYEGEMVALAPRLIEAIAAWPKAPLYPDANGTLRFTYATVKGYAPRDGVVYTPFTTLSGRRRQAHRRGAVRRAAAPARRRQARPLRPLRRPGARRRAGRASSPPTTSPAATPARRS